MSSEVARKEHTELIDTERGSVCKSALIAYREHRPLRIVHLSLYSAHRRKAGSAKKVEYERKEYKYFRE